MLHGPPGRKPKSPRSKMPMSERSLSKDSHFVHTPRDYVVRDAQIANSVVSSEYVPKIPHMCRPLTQQSPEKVPHLNRSYINSPRSALKDHSTSAISERNSFNLSTSTVFEPISRLSTSPLRGSSSQLEGFIKDGFQALKTELSYLNKELGKIGSRVDNLSTAVNILTNMQEEAGIKREGFLLRCLGDVTKEQLISAVPGSPEAMQAGDFGKEGPLQESHLHGGLGNDGNFEPATYTSDLGIVIPPPSHVMCDRALQLEKQQERSLHWTSQTRRIMDILLNEVYEALQPTREQREARQFVIQFFENFVRSRIPRSSVTVFGSYVMDMYTCSSDLDLSLNIGDVPVERSRSECITVLRKLTRALHGLQNGKNGAQRDTIRRIEPVMRAAVPVVKFVEGQTNIECDVSMENRDGVLKSQLLGIFASIDPRVRQLCFLLKAWAKAHKVNDSKKGTLNSLSIILLVAFHLQTRSPPILPPFSVFLEGLVLHATASCIAAVRQRVALCIEQGFGKHNKESVSQLFTSFFIKLLAVESLWEQGLCASTFEGKWVSKVWAKNHLGCMSVEDFAERTQNSARAVREKEFDIIHECFRETVSQLNFSPTTPSQLAELKHTIFGSKSLKRPSEEPLVQPVEKQAKFNDGWGFTGAPLNPPNWGLLDLHSRIHHGRSQQNQPYHTNHNRDQSNARQYGDAYPGSRSHEDWMPNYEHFNGCNRGSGPSPAGLHYATQTQVYARNRPMSETLAHQRVQAAQTRANLSSNGSLLRPRPGDSGQAAVYNAYQDGQPHSHRNDEGWGHPSLAATPPYPSHHPPHPEAFSPQSHLYQSDGRVNYAASLSWQRPDSNYQRPQQLGRPRYPLHYGDR